MSSSVPPPTPAAGDWLSLTPASRLLGVDPDTLRRWADEGRIESFTTPGGHRRFARLAVERLIATRRRAPAPLARLGATPERLSRAYARSYATGAAAGGDADAFRRDGRRLVAALLGHIDASTDDERSRAERDAMALTDRMARRLADAGTPLADAVALFVAARRPFFAELGIIARRRALDANRLSAAYEDASSLLDRLLLRLIATHRGEA